MTALARTRGERAGFVTRLGALTADTIVLLVALRGTEIVLAPLDEAVAAPKLLDPALYETAAVFFG